MGEIRDYPNTTICSVTTTTTNATTTRFAGRGRERTRR
jgi:hypothetical protein